MIKFDNDIGSILLLGKIDVSNFNLSPRNFVIGNDCSMIHTSGVTYRISSKLMPIKLPVEGWFPQFIT